MSHTTDSEPYKESESEWENEFDTDTDSDTNSDGKIKKNYKKSQKFPNKPKITTDRYVKRNQPKRKQQINHQRQQLKRQTQIKEIYQIPKNKVERGIMILETNISENLNDDENIRMSCNLQMEWNRNQHFKRYNFHPNSITRMFCELQMCLDNQDWNSMAKIIYCLSDEISKKSFAKDKHLLIKYALTVLLYDPDLQDTDLLEKFLHGVIGCKSKIEADEFLKSVFHLPENIIKHRSKDKIDVNDESNSSSSSSDDDVDDEKATKEIINLLKNTPFNQQKKNKN